MKTATAISTVPIQDENEQLITKLEIMKFRLHSGSDELKELEIDGLEFLVKLALEADHGVKPIK